MHQIVQIVETVWKTYAEMIKTNPVMGGAITLYGMGIFTWVFKSVPARIFNYIKAQFTVSVSIHNENELFGYTTKWLETGNRVFRCKSFLATIKHGADARHIISIAVGNGNHVFFHSGRPFWLSRVEKEVNNTTDRKESLFISTIGWYPDSIKNFLKDVLPKPSVDTKTQIYHFQESYWYSQISKESRGLDTVILTDENEKKLRDYITQYQASKAWYEEKRIPWRAGIVLEGPPGTGKSTLSLAICGEFKCSLFMANLSFVTDDKLSTMFKTLPPKSVMLVEDIDSYSVTKARKSQRKANIPAGYVSKNPALKKAIGRLAPVAPIKPGSAEDPTSILDDFGLNSLSGLLNAIDGICSTEDRILIATTNHIEKLDPALIRPGRFELILKIDYLCNETARKIFKKFYPDFKVPESFKVKPGISPVEFQTMCIGNKTDPHALLNFCHDGDTNGNA